LVDSHFGSMAMDELHEATTLAGRDLDVGNFAKSLEEGAELVLSNVSGEAADEDGGVVGVSELVHGLHWVECSTLAVKGRGSPHGARMAGNGRHDLVGPLPVSTAVLVRARLGGGCGNAHGTVAAVDTLHLDECALLIRFIAEANKPVTAGLTSHGVGHDLCRLARREARLEKGDQYKLVDLWAEVTNENGILGAAVVTAVNQATA